MGHGPHVLTYSHAGAFAGECRSAMRRVAVRSRTWCLVTRAVTALALGRSDLLPSSAAPHATGAAANASRHAWQAPRQRSLGGGNAHFEEAVRQTMEENSTSPKATRPEKPGRSPLTSRRAGVSQTSTATAVHHTPIKRPPQTPPSNAPSRSTRR